MNPEGDLTLMAWLNEYAPALSALAALVGSIATVAIAALTFGTWKLYQLERSRASESKLAFARTIFWVWKDAEHQKTFLDPNEHAYATYYGQGSNGVFRANVAAIIQRLDQLLSTATTTHLEVMAHLESARNAFRTASVYLEQSLDAKSQNEAIQRHVRTVSVLINGGICSCEKAYQALPEQEQLRDPRGRTYPEMLKAAEQLWTEAWRGEATGSRGQE